MDRCCMWIWRTRAPAELPASSPDMTASCWSRAVECPHTNQCCRQSTEVELALRGIAARARSEHPLTTLVLQAEHRT